MTRREAIGRIGAVTGGAALLGRREASAASGPPNIIFIMADDLGYGDIGCYGQQQILTPNIDAMAAEGIRFTQCYAGSPVSSPSRCALMTGYHAGHGSVPANYYPGLSADDVTVADVLKGRGYTTGAIGKWHLGATGTPGAPNQQGFDYWFGYDFGARPRDYYPPLLSKNGRPVRIRANEDGRENVYGPDLMTDKSLGFIRDNAGGPFFLYLAYSTPHADHELFRKTGNGYPVPSDAPYSDQPWPQPEKNFAAMLTRMDTHIGTILAQLESLGIADNTAVFFCSDNGPADKGGHSPFFFNSAGPFTGFKGGVYEGGIRVPMVARWPSAIPRGAVSDHMWAFWDFLPTAVEMAGGAPLAGIDGTSALPALRGQDQPQPSHLFWQNWNPTGPFQRSQAVRFGPWKAVRHGYSAPPQIFDLRSDVGETTDIADHNPELVSMAYSFLAASYDVPPPRLDWTQKLGYFGDGVAPNKGEADDTVFAYEVRFIDLDSAEPTYVRVVIHRDGTHFGTLDMQPTSTDATLPGRVYRHAMSLPPGNYEYRFEAATVHGPAEGEPTGMRVGPTMPAPPYLTWTGQPGYQSDGVKPESGDPDATPFMFKVVYRANDGDMPRYVRLRLYRDGASHDVIDMDTKETHPDPAAGIVYRATTTLPAGRYQYSFRARNKSGPATGEPTKRVKRGLKVCDGSAVAIAALSAVPTATGAQINLVLSSSAAITARITNIAGRPVATKCGDAPCAAGTRALLWNATSDNGLRVPNGTYLVEVIARGQDGTQARAVTRVAISR